MAVSSLHGIDQEEEDAELHVEDLPDEDGIHQGEDGEEVKEDIAVEALRVDLDRGLLQLAFSQGLAFTEGKQADLHVGLRFGKQGYDASDYLGNEEPSANGT